MGGQGAGVLAGTGGWDGWAGPPTIEEVTMSMKSMLSGTEGLGGWRVRAPAPPDLALSLALSFLTPPALRALSASYCSLLWASRLPRPPAPRTSSAPPVTAPGLACPWPGPCWPALLSAPPPHSL